MNNWYSFTPTDTLFCKGAEPMILGENHTASHLFPPPAQTIVGAVRTAVLIQNDVPFGDYAKGKAPPHIIEAIGEAGTTPPFKLVGPLFEKDGDVFISAPYSWYAEEETLAKHMGVEKKQSVKVFKSSKITSDLVSAGVGEIYWAKAEIGQLVSLGGMWVKFQDVVSGKDEINVKKNDYFFTLEPRTGIALQASRKVREGHLYSFSHVRLQKGVHLVFGIDRDLPFADSGILKVGAEHRFGQYNKFSSNDFHFNDKGNLFLSLSLVEGTDAANDAVVATGRVSYIGGWDLHKGFHKPMKGFFPAGSVFNKKINNNFISIEGE